MTTKELTIATSTVWVLIAAILVMFMQAGFAFLEAGLTRMKNVGHIAAKNVLIFALASVVYFLVGYGLAFGDGGNGLFSSPPECLFHHQATFMTEFFESRAGARKGEYDFFPFPVLDQRFAKSVTGGGDLFGIFNDTPQSRALMEYLLLGHLA